MAVGDGITVLDSYDSGVVGVVRDRNRGLADWFRLTEGARLTDLCQWRPHRPKGPLTAPTAEHASFGRAALLFREPILSHRNVAGLIASKFESLGSAQRSTNGSAENSRETNDRADLAYQGSLRMPNPRKSGWGKAI